jgi:putative pyruvate formate lyase activating enzyme
VNRIAGERGCCRAGADLQIYRFAPHPGEEPPISGTRGSGTVFFSRCTLDCLYCQNYPWSHEGNGELYTVDALADALVKLARAGCHNWNLVSPTPWLPAIREAVRLAGARSVSLPVVYNTSGYERPEILEEFSDLDYIYLTDLRYSRPERAAEGSGRAEYVAAARDALQTMWRLAGPLRVNTEGVAEGGVICRLLVLPGHENEAIENLAWLAETVGTDVSISLMSQYTPAFRAVGVDAPEPWNRRISQAAYDNVCEAVEQYGFTRGWIQGYDTDTDAPLIGYRMPKGEG